MRKNPGKNLTISDEEKDALLAIFPQGIVAFDLEMTGLSALLDKIIEIAAVRITPDGEVDYFHELVNPLVEIPEFSIQYHNITNEMVREKSTLKRPLRSFKDFYENLPLIAHNAQFDAGFIVRGHHEYNFEFSLSDIYDSCKLSRAVYKKFQGERPPNFKLSTLAEFFKMEFRHHRAIEDAVISLKVFAQCLLQLQAEDKKQYVRENAFVFKMNSFRRPEEYILPRKYKTLIEYVQNQTQVDIMYQSGSFKNEYRPIKPIALLPMPSGIILYAQCLKSSTNKHFRLKKIKDIKLTN